MIDYTATYTDQYQLTMAQVYYQTGRHKNKAVFDYFFRKLPFDGGYAVFCGLDTLIDVLENLRFDEQDLAYMKKTGLDPDFVDYLENFEFKGNVYSSREGDLVFSTRPVLQVEADIIEAQIIETLLLNILNIQTLVATKASRMRLAAGERKLVDFGLRRAHGPGGYYASRAAIAGGFDSTSNVRAGRDFDIPISGTMAHSFVQSYDNEIDSFRDFAAGRPNDCVLLVDTYDTINSGVPNAITVGKEMEEKGHKLKGIRLDSGDLAWLAKESRRMMDDAGLPYVKIAASNQLDEYLIKSLLDQEAPIDLFGVGTSLVIGRPDSALDGVYKLSYANKQPRIKLSETIEKVTLPDRNQVYRVWDEEGKLIGADAVALEGEEDFNEMFHPFEPHQSLTFENCTKEPLLHKVMENGSRVSEKKTLNQIREFAMSRLSELPDEYKRFENPHIYKVGMSKGLKDERDTLIERYKG